MPIMQVFVLEGRTDEQKAAFIAAVTEAAALLDAPAESVRIIITDMPLANFGSGGKTAKQKRLEQAAQAQKP